MRAGSNELEILNFLLKIGDVIYPIVNSEPSNGSPIIDLPEEIIAKDDIVTEMLRRYFSSPDQVINFSKFAILAPKNEHINEINSKVLDLIPSIHKTCITQIT